MVQIQSLDHSEPCGIESVVSCRTSDQWEFRVKFQCKDEAIRVGPPKSGFVHMQRPLTGITPQPSVGMCGENTLRLLLARARISMKFHFTGIRP